MKEQRKLDSYDCRIICTNSKPLAQVEKFSEVLAMSTNSSEISLMLDQYREGQAEAFGKLMALVYDDLRRLAAWQLQTER
jgi:hypothetical protein